MLERNRRLINTDAIRTVLRRGNCVATASVRVCVLRSAGPFGQVAIVVGKKVHIRATVRHRYQRWLRVLAREALAEQVTLTAYDMVWVGLPGLISHQRLATLRPEVRLALGRLTRKLKGR